MAGLSSLTTPSLTESSLPGTARGRKLRGNRRGKKPDLIDAFFCYMRLFHGWEKSMHMHRVWLQHDVTLITQISQFRIHPSVSSQSESNNNSVSERKRSSWNKYVAKTGERMVVLRRSLLWYEIVSLTGNVSALSQLRSSGLKGTNYTSLHKIFSLSWYIYNTNVVEIKQGYH